ncbi:MULTISPECIES: HPr family phosphocarrier protein [Haloarcula]|uniref:Phosphotransferase n=1 Tax=Haloarcula pellucida TaxID=1427151 RepID=A0A830GLQ0_9EURY|nr:MULTISPECIES: HPr family phosphocarrier protein [Halomicroarcula]MBX0349676.1 HPr family phosphocarrier protein [Halomicroarcula pellucida]MDS0279818.1 HPr family phosphocarrier protein [Halomicroarcula sp. S1AR25-4]QIO24442.1 HPr family phosphocarrier protein [Haloarcula sp. JP-L23]GGN95849.1 phosphotransferase [Halomicroarcula pellucida]
MSVERTVTIVPEAGLHARPAAAFVEAVNDHEAEVSAGQPGDDLVQAGSMIAVTSLGVGQGDELRLVADGPDAAAVLDELEDILTTPEEELSA